MTLEDATEQYGSSNYDKVELKTEKLTLHGMIRNPLVLVALIAAAGFIGLGYVGVILWYVYVLLAGLMTLFALLTWKSNETTNERK